MRQLLVNPDEFFAEKAHEMGFRWPLLVVLFAGLSIIASNIIVITKLFQVFDAVGQLVVTVTLVVIILSTGGGIFVLWLLIAGLSYSISLLFDAEGDFRILLMYLGWTFVPVVFAGVIATAVVYASVQGVAPPQDPSALSTYVERVRSNPLRSVARISAVVLTLWQGFLSAFAVKHARNVSLRDAALIVAGPTALILVSTTITSIAPTPTM